MFLLPVSWPCSASLSVCISWFEKPVPSCCLSRGSNLSVRIWGRWLYSEILYSTFIYIFSHFTFQATQEPMRISPPLNFFSKSISFFLLEREYKNSWRRNVCYSTTKSVHFSLIATSTKYLIFSWGREIMLQFLGLMRWDRQGRIYITRQELGFLSLFQHHFSGLIPSLNGKVHYKKSK